MSAVEVARGVRLGVDVGDVRVGLARSDRDALLATPVETVSGDRTAQLARIAEVARDLEAVGSVVGLPRHLSGSEGRAAAVARGYAEALAQACQPVPVRLVDERLSTVSAHTALRQSGRSQKGSRGIVDQIAAVVFLQHAVDTEKSTGRAPGAVLDEE